MSKYYKNESRRATVEEPLLHQSGTAAMRKTTVRDRQRGRERECEEKEAEGSATEGCRAHARRDRGAV